MSAPMENHRDRFFIPTNNPPPQTKQTITRRDSAIRAINNWFINTNNDRTLEMMTIDAIVQRCFQLRAVVSYIADEEASTHYHHHNNIRAHICMKLKEYIDGKF